MHSKVKQFWEKRGYEFTNYSDMTNHFTNWYVRKGDDWRRIFAASIYRTKDDVYLYDGKKYSTKEMLKLIKLKAFL